MKNMGLTLFFCILYHYILVKLFGHLFPSVLWYLKFGHVVFIYSVVWFQSNVPASYSLFLFLSFGLESA